MAMIFRKPVEKQAADNEALSALLDTLLEAHQGLAMADRAVRNVNGRYGTEMALLGVDTITERFHDEWAGYMSDFGTGRSAAADAIQAMMNLLSKSR